MAIAFACEGCGKKYEVSEGLAGKKGRCKQCGNVFHIPRPGQPIEDIYGLDEPAVVAKPEPTEELASSRRRVAEPARATTSKSSRPVDSENKEQFRRIGIGLLVSGIAVFILPFLGLQLRVVNVLPPAAQAAAGILMVISGVVLLAISAAGRPMRVLGFLVGGFVGLIVLVFLLAIVLLNRNAGRTPRPSPVLPARGGPMPVGPGGLGTPPKIDMGGPPPQQSRPEPVPTTVQETKISLANAKAAREPGPGMIIKNVSFQVDYKFDGGAPPVRPLTWVIESPQTKARMPFVRLNASGGSLSGTMTVTNGDQGPYECYLGLESFGPGGKSYEKVSNTVSMQWMGDAGLEPNAKPTGRPPGFPGGGGMPPRPSSGPRGPRSRP